MISYEIQQFCQGRFLKKNIADSIININAKNGKLNMIHMIRLKIYGALYNKNVDVEIENTS